MVAQGCFKRELEGLSARLEARSGAAHPWQSLTTRRNLTFYPQKAIGAAELQMPLEISISHANAPAKLRLKYWR